MEEMNSQMMIMRQAVVKATEIANSVSNRFREYKKLHPPHASSEAEVKA
jgi:hypothetical protein